ncbi:MAG: ZIP family metal transporter [Lachnospiraceae bacterium]|nr:ZIP family metal transporter [Lachnospiraceae bacterium]
MNSFLGIMIPFVGTTAGAACVFFLMGEIRVNVQKSLLGFAAGVMLAASVWSLLIPSINMSEGMGRLSFVPAAVGFSVGIATMLLLDQVVPEIYIQEKGGKAGSRLSKNAMLILAVTIHNIPEGMAVGVAFAGMLSGTAGITAADAFALAVGIAVQNFPEGAIISLPLRAEGMRKRRAFYYGTASGAVEPAAALLTILLSAFITPILPYLLAFAAGAMVYVVVEELIPEAAQEPHSHIGTVGAALGFLIMMTLDVMLG